MARLPLPGSDDGVWGNILNDYLSVEHNTDGTHRVSVNPDATTTSKGKIMLAGDLGGTAGSPTVPGLAAKASDAAVVHNTGNETVAGIKTFTSAPVVPSNAFPEAAITNLTADLAAKIAKGSQNIYASDYGALFDGSTDDAAALQSAINAAVTANKPLLLPPGTAIIGTALSIASTVTIIGSGRQATILKAKNGLNNYVISFTGGTAGVGIIGVYLSDFAVDGNCANQTAGGGILASGSVHGTFERLHMYGCYDWGLKIGPITGGAFGHHNKVIGCLFDNAGSSAGFGGGANTTSSDENWFLACDFEFLGGSTNPVGSNPVALLEQAGLQHIISCNFVGGSHNCHGIRIQNAKDNRVIGCTFDGIAGDSVFIAGSKNIVANNEFTSPGDQGSVAASGVHLEFGTHNNVVSGNSLETSSTAGRTRSLIREESTGGSGSNLITGNSLTQIAAPSVALLESAGAGTILRNNIGWATEASGTAAVASGTTSVAVTHGLSFTPTIAQVSVTPNNNLGTATKFWVSAVGATTFTINVDVDPGAATAAFAWSIKN